MKILLSFFLTISVIISSRSQALDSTAQTKQWTLQECINYALANNLQVKRSELNVESNEIDLLQSRASLLPSANASASYGYNWGRGLDPVTNQFVSSQRNNVSSFGANGSVPLFNGFRLTNSIKQFSSSVAASEQELMKAKNDVTLNVVTLFLNVVFNKELLENAKLQLGSSQQQLERIKRQVAVGALPRADELNMEAQVATNELSVINQENTLILSLLQLQQAMQLPARGDFDVLIPGIDPEDLVLDLTRDEIFNIAKETMPEMKASKLRVESSYYGIKASRGNLVPRLSLNGSINTNYSKNSETRVVYETFTETRQIGYAQDGVDQIPVFSQVQVPITSTERNYFFNDQFKDNLYKSVNLSLIIPILNGFSARSAVKRSIIANEQARINQLETENTLRQTIETAYNDAIAASKSYSSSVTQVQAREEAFRVTKERFDNGASNYFDYQVAENNFFQAKSDLARAKFNFIFRKKLLDFYQGKPIEL